jgi:hypothetical protein
MDGDSTKDRSVCGLTDVGGIRQYNVEDWLELARRGADDFQHFAGRGLALARVIKFTGELVKLSCTLAGDAWRIGTFRALDLFLRRTFAGCPLLPRRLIVAPRGSDWDGINCRVYSERANALKGCPLPQRL